MAEPDVIKIMGKPQSRAESKDGSVRLYYSLIEGPGAVFPYTIVLVNGKVDAYGRDGAQNADHLGITPMPVMVPLVH
jgi:hypothetical protein